MRVLICDDSAFMRKAIAMLLDNEADIEVIETARHGEDALEKIKRYTPDILTLDLEMPVLDGMGTLTRIKAEISLENRPAILVCSTLSSKGSHEALKAMRLGASDVIFKDTAGIGGGSQGIKPELCSKLRAIYESLCRTNSRVRAAATTNTTNANAASKKPKAHASLHAHAIRALDPSPVHLAPPVDAAKLIRDLSLRTNPPELIVIGSSTGGPPVLEQILSTLPADMPCPIVVAQHMPALFTKSLAERLNELCNIEVVHADAQSTTLKPGCAYVIVGGKHGRVIRSGSSWRVDVSEKPLEALYKPSVDELMLSAAQSAGKGVLAVMLTGMGDDGSRGAKALFDAGATVLTQHADSCVVYGMPRAVVQLNASTAPMNPDAIAKVLVSTSPTGVAAIHTNQRDSFDRFALLKPPASTKNQPNSQPNNQPNNQTAANTPPWRNKAPSTTPQPSQAPRRDVA